MRKVRRPLFALLARTGRSQTVAAQLPEPAPRAQPDPIPEKARVTSPASGVAIGERIDLRPALPLRLLR